MRLVMCEVGTIPLMFCFGFRLEHGANCKHKPEAAWDKGPGCGQDEPGEGSRAKGHDFSKQQQHQHPQQ